MNDLTRLSNLVLARSAGLTLYARQWVDASAAEDVIQTALVALLSQRNPPEDPVAWMYRAVRNGAIDLARAESRRKRRENLVAIQKSGRVDWFENSSIDEIDAAGAEAALRQLPAEAREIVVMRLWGDLGFSAISAVLGVSVSTAHARYQSSLKQLRELMEQSCKKKTLKQI